MKKLLALVISLVLLIGLSSGCSSQAQQMREYTDPAQGIEATAGSQFVIVLESNPTTGFKWEASFNTSLLKLAKSEYKQTETKPGLVGGGGKEYFTFEGLKKGSDKITMTYKRSWEQGSANQKVFNVVIK